MAAGPTALPGRQPELAQVNGTFRCTVDGAVALTLRQDSHQLSLSGRGLCRPMAAICFAARYSPGRGCRRCWRCWSRARQRITPRARRRGSCRENGYHRSKNDDTSRVIAALSLCLVWLSTAVRPGAGQLLQCGDLSSAAHVDPDRGRRADNPQHPGLFLPAVPPADRPGGTISRCSVSSGWAVAPAAVRRPSRGAIR